MSAVQADCVTPAGFRVVVYSRDGCAPCADMTAWLRDKRVDFAVVDVTRVHCPFVKRVPLCRVRTLDGDILVDGYDPAALTKALHRLQSEGGFAVTSSPPCTD